MDSGPPGLSIFIALPIIPGVAVGTQEPLTIAPALPKEAPAPGPVLSIKTTLWPSLCKAIAQQIPIIPAPTT